jgi:uncharacterized membrane protein YccC
MLEEPDSGGRGWELPIGLVLGVVAAWWIGWHNGNVVVGVVLLIFVTFLSVLFFVGRSRK